MSRRRKTTRRPRRTALVTAIALLLLGLMAVANRIGLWHGSTASPQSGEAAGNTVKATVLDVVDGDTIKVDIDGQTYSVRYIGVDTPEVYSTIEPYGVAATDANEALVAGQTVYLEKDVSETDRYGRLLRYVWVDGVLVNEELARQGLARADSYPPDVKYDDRLDAAEDEARAAGRGLWSDSTPAPGPSTAAGCTGGCTTPPAGCSIKGNINADGDKYYHLPGGTSYEVTRIDPGKGERWFCTTAEAEAAGWSAAP